MDDSDDTVVLDVARAFNLAFINKDDSAKFRCIGYVQQMFRRIVSAPDQRLYQRLKFEKVISIMGDDVNPFQLEAAFQKAKFTLVDGWLEFEVATPGPRSFDELSKLESGLQRASDLLTDPDSLSLSDVAQRLQHGRAFPGVQTISDIPPVQPAGLAAVPVHTSSDCGRSDVTRPPKPWESENRHSNIF
eukprot:Selendium_serpulae@DN2423_c0_g1_i1.p1